MLPFIYVSCMYVCEHTVQQSECTVSLRGILSA